MEHRSFRHGGGSGTWEYGKPAVQPVFVWQTVIENAPTYSVTIPETAAVNGDVETVSANAGALRADQAIVVSVAADNKFKLENGKSSTVGYQLFVGDSTTAVNAGGTILSTGNTSQNGEAASVKIRFALSENAPYAGNYSGTCKFVVSVEDNAS